MTILTRNLLLFRAVMPGGITPTGDQGVFNEWAFGGATIADPYVYGNAFAPTNATIAAYTGGLAWNTPNTNRLQAYGPSFLAPETGTVTLEAFCQGGTSAKNFRLALYQDNGNATTTQVGRTGDTDSYNAGSRPATLVGVGAQVTVAASAVSNWRGDLATALSVTAGNIYHVALWTDPTANGAQFLLFTGGVNINRYRTNTGIVTYNAVTPPPASFPTSGSTTDVEREDLAIRITFTPAALVAPASVVTTPVAGVRALTTTWDSVALADYYQVERSKNGGAFAILGAVTSLSYPDYDLEDGATYQYRVAAVRQNRVGLTTTGTSIATSGVRIAFATATPTLAPSTTRIDNPLRGLHGADITIGSVEDYEEYERVQFPWSALEPTLGNYTLAPIIAFLDSLAPNKRAWIRIRTSVPGSLTTLPADISPAYYDDFSGISATARYPRWNDPYILNADGVSGRLQLLVAWLATAETSPGVLLIDDPRFALVDAGFYAQFGEWTGDVGPVAATAATQILLIDLTAAFSKQSMVMSAMDTGNAALEATLWYALGLSRVIGFRQDAFGRLTTPYQFQQFVRDRSLRASNRMRDRTWFRSGEHFTAFTAANSTAWQLSLEEVQLLYVAQVGGVNLTNYPTIGATNQQRVLDSIRLSGYRFDVLGVRYPSPAARGNAVPFTMVWRNVGNARMVEGRTVQVQLRQAGGLVWSQNLSLDITTLLPFAPPVLYSDTLDVSAVSPGTYDLCVQLIENGSRRPAVRTGITPEQSGVYYILSSGVSIL